VSQDAYLWLTIVSALVSCFAAIGARTLREFSRHDLQEICQRRQDPDRFGDILRHHDRVGLGVEMMVVFAATLAVAAGSLWGFTRLTDTSPGGWTLVAFVLVLGLALAVATVWLPWSIARIGAAKFLYHTWLLWWLLSRVTAPLVGTARVMDMLMHRLAGRSLQQPDEESFEEEIRTIVTEGHREGLLEEEAREMIEGVIELGDADVEHIMTPRTEMHMLQVNTPWEKMLADVISLGHTRIPVYDKNRDDIIGMLYIKDLLPELAKGPGEQRRPPKDILRKPLFVPETKAVDDLLQMFQQSRTHIAVVLDEYGGVSGLVTIEDVLEEIVGEIVDEYDKEVEEEICKIDEDVCEALGRAHVDQINEAMGFELPENEDFDTVGGFVFAEFGRVPMVGELLTWQAGNQQPDQPVAGSVRVTVLDATRRRINRVRLERIRRESLEIA
jgi:CBS domain containing-hemolysin-like protein